jgi:hypothetical protein
MLEIRGAVGEMARSLSSHDGLAISRDGTDRFNRVVMVSALINTW